jgi:hypothetical protein
MLPEDFIETLAVLLQGSFDALAEHVVETKLLVLQD